MGHGPYAKLVMVFLFTSLAFMVRFPKTSPFFLVCARLGSLFVFPVALRFGPELFNFVYMCVHVYLHVCSCIN